MLQGGADVGAALAAHEGVAIVSATGSTRMGRAVAPVVASRFGRLILELGGNNAAVVAPSADLELAVRGIAFSAVGTAGQRCTSLRRLIVHESVRDELVDRLAKAYSTVPIGDPLADGTLVGPLIDTGAFDQVRAAIENAAGDGGKLVVGGERVLADVAPDARYVEPAIVTMPGQTEIVRTETFGPLLYVLGYDDFDEALALHNDVPQGLASSIFTNDVREAERFMSAEGSDCGIANVNIGPSGRRDRRRLRRREGDRRRPGVGLRRLEGLHAPGHQHRQLLDVAPPRPGRHLRHLRTLPIGPAARVRWRAGRAPMVSADDGARRTTSTSAARRSRPTGPTCWRCSPSTTGSWRSSTTAAATSTSPATASAASCCAASGSSCSSTPTPRCSSCRRSPRGAPTSRSAPACSPASAWSRASSA